MIGELVQESPALHDMVQRQGWPLGQVEQHSVHAALVIVVTFQGRLGWHQPRQDDRRPPAHLPALALPVLYLPVLELLFMGYGRRDTVGSLNLLVQ